jgi:hypothetical protein
MASNFGREGNAIMWPTCRRRPAPALLSEEAGFCQVKI